MKKPWVGTSPWLMTIRGGVQLALSLVFVWGSLQVIGDHIDLSEYSALADQQETAKRVAWGVLVVAALFAVYSGLRLAIGITDLVSPREVVDGVVVRTANREPVKSSV